MPWFEVAGTSIYDRLRGAWFHWIVFTGETGGLPGELPSGWSGRIDTHRIELSEVIKERFGRSEPFGVLLRPDNYIGLITDDISPDVLAEYLDRFG